MAKKYLSEEIDSYELAGGVDTFIEYLEKRIEETGQPRENIFVSVDCVPDYGDRDRAVVVLSYEREETSEERNRRLEFEKKREDYERKEYNRLRAKFENKA